MVWETAPTSPNIHKTHLPLHPARNHIPSLLAVVSLQTPGHLQTGRTPRTPCVTRNGVFA